MAELVAAVPLLRADQAEQRYNAALQTAVEACAADTEGQTCYICLEAVAPESNEGLVRGCACRGAAGVAHVSCLARQAQVAVERRKRGAGGPGFLRWSTCGLCKQEYHGVVHCALGWACWKTYLSRPERDWVRMYAMSTLGNGLHSVNRFKDAVAVKEAELAMERRVGDANGVLIVQGNLALSYLSLRRYEDASRMQRDVYSGRMKLNGEEHFETLLAANNYADSLRHRRHFERAKALLRKTLPMARRVLGESHDLTLRMRWNYAEALHRDPDATLDDLREAVATLEDMLRIARRVMGGAHPLVEAFETSLRDARAALSARETAETPSGRSA